MIDIDFVIIFVILNNNSYIFMYCVFNYDDNCIFDLYVSYMLFIAIFFTSFKSVISYHFCNNFFKSIKE